MADIDAKLKAKDAELGDGFHYTSKPLSIDETQALLGENDLASPPVPEWLLPFRLDIAYELYQVLFGRFEDLIRDKHVLIVADGPLATLPFQVLVTAKPPTTLVGMANLADYTTVSWLGTHQALSVLPSVSSLYALRKLAKAGTAPEAFTGFGNPLLVGKNGDDLRASEASANSCSTAQPEESTTETSLAGSNARLFTLGVGTDVEEVHRLPPVPDTTKELCAIAASLEAPESDVHLGANATETVVKELSESGKLARSRVVVFATHALLLGNNTPIESGLIEPALVLTPPAAGGSPGDLERDNGLLMASDVVQLKLNADWVVLAACNTAGGDKLGGEALSRLARAFFYAGARSLLVSHWAASTDATVKLTTRAFTEIKDHPDINCAEALRRSIAALNASGPRSSLPSIWGPVRVCRRLRRAAK